jgi:hypothetical protein
VLVPFDGAGAVAAGLDAAVEVFGLNKSPIPNLPGESDGAGWAAGAGVALAFFIAQCLRAFAMEKAIQPDSATAPVKYKCRQIQQQR